MKKILTVLGVLFLVGCASADLTPQELALIQSQMDQKTLQIDCPSGCRVQYKDPRDTVNIPRKTNGWDAVVAVSGSAERLLGAAIVPAAMAYQGVELGKAAIGALKGSGAVTNTTTSTATTTTSSEVGDYSGDYSGSVGDYSGSDSGNSGELITGNSGSVASPVDSTHTPTVVTETVTTP